MGDKEESHFCCWGSHFDYLLSVKMDLGLLYSRFDLKSRKWLGILDRGRSLLKSCI
jgi:hypothetical protein